MKIESVLWYALRIVIAIIFRLIPFAAILSRQNVVLDGLVVINGSLSLKHGTESIISNNQTVNVNDRTYIRMSACNQFVMKPFVRLTDEHFVGQALTRESLGFINTWSLDDNSDDVAFPGPFGNINIPANRTLSLGDLIQLLWNADEWIQVNF
jgi:hypothetical protein